MNTLLQIANWIVVGLCAVLAVRSYLSWRKEGYRCQQWYFILAAAITISTAWSYLVLAVFDVAGMTRSINFGIVDVSYALEIMVFVYIQLQVRSSLHIQQWTDEQLKTGYISEVQDWKRTFGKTQNAQSKELTAAEAKLKMIYWEIQRRDPQLNLLLPLLNSEKDSVRLVAAGHLLKTVPEKAVPVLREIGSKGGDLGDVANKLLHESSFAAKSL